MKLLVIVVRGLQARMLGAYGNRWIESSCLDLLASMGVVFDQHFAICPAPAQARLVWRTGMHPLASEKGEMPISDDWLTQMQHQGVETRLFVDVSRGSFPSFHQGWSHVETFANARETISRARESLTATGSDWITWVDLATLIPPWEVPEALIQAYFDRENSEDDHDEDDVADDEEEEITDARDFVPVEPPLEPIFDPGTGPIDARDDVVFLRLRETYAAAVSYVDGLLGELLDGLADDVFVIVTADGGLSLGERGVVGMRHVGLHQEGVHVPLIFYGPGLRAGRRIEALIGSHDLAPTLAELAGTTLTQAQGISLLAYVGGSACPERSCLYLGDTADNTRYSTLRTQNAALISIESDIMNVLKLYAKPDDYFEVNDLSNVEFAKTEQLEKLLRDCRLSAERPGRLNLEWEAIDLQGAQSE